MTKVFGYVRVSTAKQGEGVSLSEQRDSIDAYAAQNGLQIVEWFEEKETAAKRGRPVFTEMLQRLRKGDADGLIIHKIDRSARNLRDWADLAELMDEGVGVHTAHESLDLNSNGGRLSADLQAVIAANYIRNLSDETKKGHRGRLKQGIWPYPAPIGYNNAGPGKVKMVDPAQGPLVRKAFELYATGNYGLPSLSDEMHDRGLRTSGGKRVHTGKMWEILRNPFYTGLMRVCGHDTFYPGKHEPLVTKVLFDEVGGLLSGKAVKRRRLHDYLYRLLFNCGLCGRYMVASRHKGHVYYRCQKSGCLTKTVREESIEEVVDELTKRIDLRPDIVAYLKQLLEESRSEAFQDAERLVASRRRDLGLVHSRLDRLTEGYLDGDIDRDHFRRTKGELSKRQSEIENELRSPEREIDRIYDRIDQTLELAEDAQQSYRSGSPDEKRVMLRSISSNRIVIGREPTVELSNPFEILASSAWFLNGCPYQDVTRTGHAKKLFAALLVCAKEQVLPHGRRPT